MANDDYSDDTSNEAVDQRKHKLLTQPHTAALKDFIRKPLKRGIKFGAFLTTMDPRQDIPLETLESFVVHKFKFLNKKLKHPDWKKLLKTQHETSVAGTMQLNCLYGDERASHAMHMSSIMADGKNDDGIQWTDKDWFKKVVNVKWNSLNPRSNKYVRIDTSSLTDNKSPMYPNFYGKPRILKMLREWVLADIQRMIRKFKLCQSNDLEWGKVKISIFGIIWQIAEAMFYWDQMMVSHTYDEETKDLEARQFFLDDDVYDWYCRSYGNGNGLPYIMMYNAIDSNGKLHSLIQDGIPKSMDVKMSLSHLIKREVNQKGFLEHYIMSGLKFLVFFPVHETGINGQWNWSIDSMHLPWLDMLSVTRALSTLLYQREAIMSVGSNRLQH